MLTGLIAALIVMASAAVLYRVSSRATMAKLPSPSDQPLLGRTIRDLRPDDVIVFDGTDYLVTGAVTYTEDGHRWVAGLITDGEKDYWLYLGLDRVGAGTARLLQSINIELTAYPPDSLTWERFTLSQKKRGTATCQTFGAVGSRTAGVGRSARCRWWLYSDTDGRSIVVEQWGDDFHVVGGKDIRESSIEFLPGT